MTKQEKMLIDHFGTEEVHIDCIKVGDTVIHDEAMKTVCRQNIGGDTFMGRTLWGDSYKLGTVPVKRVSFTTEKANG